MNYVENILLNDYFVLTELIREMEPNTEDYKQVMEAVNKIRDEIKKINETRIELEKGNFRLDMFLSRYFKICEIIEMSK